MQARNTPGMCKTRWPLPLLLLALVGSALGAPFRAAEGKGWEEDPAFQELRAREVKSLGKLMGAALRAKHTTTAWWLADRILAVDPEHSAATALLERVMPDDLDAAKPPNAKARTKLAEGLRDLGDQYFRFGETLEASGMDPGKYYPINLQAHRYGSEAANLVKALRDAGEMWCGVFDHKPLALLESKAPRVASSLSWPPAYTHDLVRLRGRWPTVRVGEMPDVRFFADVPFEDLLVHLQDAMDMDQWILSWQGRAWPPKIKRSQDPLDVLLFLERKDFERVGAEILHERELDRFEGVSAFSSWRRGVLVARHNEPTPWVAPRRHVAGAVARALLQRRFSAGQGGRMRGRGAWLLDGLAGAFEGFFINADGQPEIDTKRIWRLAAARVLRDQDRLLAWDDLFALDAKGARDLPRGGVELMWAGSKRAVTEADLVNIQATALAVGLLKAGDKKHLGRVAKLIEDLIKRDRLPDIDKSLRWRNGEAIRQAERAIEAAGS